MNAYVHNSELSFRGMNILTSHEPAETSKMELAVEPIYPMTTDYENVEGHNDLLCTSIIMEAFSCKNRIVCFVSHVRLRINKKKKKKKGRRRRRI